MQSKIKTQIRVGKPSYINAIPYFFGLEESLDCCELNFLDAVPSVLNQSIREGKVDITLASSIEYAKNSDSYYILPDLGLSTQQICRSVILFTKDSIKSLESKEIFVTKETSSSIVLLDILLKECFEVNAKLTVLKEEDEGDVIRSGRPCLVIGDKALLLRKQLEETDIQCFDLSSLWWAWLERPFCFALWLVRKEYFEKNKETVQSFTRLMRAQVEQNKSNLIGLKQRCLEEMPNLSALTDEELVEYLDGFEYRLNSKAIQGLYLFFEKAYKLGWVSQLRELEFAL